MHIILGVIVYGVVVGFLIALVAIGDVEVSEEINGDKCSACGERGMEDGFCMNCGKPSWISNEEWEKRQDERQGND